MPRLLIESDDGHIALNEPVHPSALEDEIESRRVLERLTDAVQDTMVRERLTRHRTHRDLIAA